MAQLVEVLLYKPEGSVFENRWCHWNFATQKTALEDGTDRLFQKVGNELPLLAA